MDDKDLDSLFNEWEELEIENNNYKKKEALNIFLVFICYMLKNNLIMNENKKFDINSLD